MFRLLRVALLQVVLLLLSTAATSAALFVLLDPLGRWDWWGTVEPARELGLGPEEAVAAELPALLNRDVHDAQRRTLEALSLLARPGHAQEGRAALRFLGTAALPTLLPALRTGTPESRQAMLLATAEAARPLGGEPSPGLSEELAVGYWDDFASVHAMQLRAPYARRLVARALDARSQAAQDEVLNLGSLALPALFDALARRQDRASALELGSLLERLVPSPRPVLHPSREGWLAWWFAHKLHLQNLTEPELRTAVVLETRHGRWWVAAWSGRLGPAAVTGRPVLRELRFRLPHSFLIAGLGGLLATAFLAGVFDRPSRVRAWWWRAGRVLSSLLPGALAFVFSYVVLLRLCGGSDVAEVAREVVRGLPRIIAAALLTGAAVVPWLRRAKNLQVLRSVRQDSEARSEANQGLGLRVVLRGVARLGLTSLLAPLGLGGPVLALLTLLTEPLLGVQGLGALTLRSLFVWDPSWLLVASLTGPSLLLSAWWARRLLVAALDAPLRESVAPPQREEGA